MTPRSNDTPQSLRSLQVLLIENDPAVARLTSEAFKEAGLTEGVLSVPDGDEALNYLRQLPQKGPHAHPDLIFLDLHLPKKSGLEVLAELKSTPRLTATPVVVVSGSADPEEIREAYELHASCYVRKPDDLDEFLHFVRTCFEFWGTFVVFPPNAVSSGG
jgi:two-component system, chemotaxis family, response regulator Rcp1